MKFRSASRVFSLFRSSSLFKKSFTTLMAALLCLPLQGATTITFTDGQTDNTNHDTSGANNPTTLTIATGTATLSGVLGGSGAVFKTGAGTLILAGANSHSGGTTVNAGLLEVTLGGAISHSAAATIIGSALGDNATLNLSGGSVSNTTGTIGNLAGSSGTANVSGSGSWTNSTTLIIGNLGSGVLNLSGGTVSNTTGTLGSSAGSSGTVNVSGSGSWTNSSTLTVGSFGTGVLNLSGGTVSSGGGTLGVQANSSGTVNVSGSGNWSNSSTLFIGSSGTGVLNLSGGTVSISFSTVGLNASGSGTVNVSAGSWISSGNLTFGGNGTGALNLSGGTVSNTTGNIGVGAGSSGTANVSGTGGWTNSSSLTIAGFGTGVLNLSGGTVSNTSGTIGNSAGSKGTVNVSGSGSWTNSSTLVIGNSGTGVLNLTAGSVSTTNSVLGSQTGSSGTANVSGGTWTNTFSLLTIGSLGTGVLNLSGGSVSNVTGVMGTNAGSNGTANVSGGTWINSSSLTIGSSGTGVLNLSGGSVSNTTSIVGQNAGSSGTVNVSGGNWTNSGNVTLGGTGTGVLNLTGGTVTVGVGGAGTVTLGSLGTLNLGTGSTVGTLSAASVTSASSAAVVNFNHSGSLSFTPALAGSLVVNKLGSGTTTLTKANTYTGRTSVNAGTLTLAFGTVSSNIISTSSALTLGGGTLSLTGTGTQTFNGLTTTASTSSRILLGANETLTLGALTSAGANSALNFNTVAGGANGATVGSGKVVLTGLTANPGFTVTDAGGFGLAGLNGSNQIIRLTTTALLPVSGAGSPTHYHIDNNAGGSTAIGSSSLIVTASESAGSITVDTTARNGVLTLNSGVVLRSNVWNFGGTGSNTYQITGSTSGAGISAVASGNAITFNNFNSGTITLNSPILANGMNAVLFQGAGTLVLTAASTYTGGTTVAGGTLEVATGGSISHTITGMVVASASGNQATLNLTGGTVSSITGTVGGLTGASGTVNVSGGSWTNSSNLGIGASGIGVLNLSGGSVSSSIGTLGGNAGSSGTANVSGSGSWTNSGTLTIGNLGTGVLTLSSGSVSNTTGTLGNLAGSSGTATVSGGSWTNSSTLFIGLSGTGVLNVSGGTVSNTLGTLGANAGSVGTANVSGGTWNNSDQFTVGNSGTGVLIISGGGVSSTSGFLGNNAGSSGTATVSSGTWTNSGTLTVGNAGTGMLTLSGGSVGSAGGVLGNSAGAAGTVTISSGSWTNSGALTVGNSGTAVLNVTGGTVSNTGGTVGSQSGSRGTVTVSGGSWTNSIGLIVGNSGTGVLIISGGTVSNTLGTLGLFSSGTATVSGGNWTNSTSLTIGSIGTGVLNLTGGAVTVGAGGDGTVTMGSKGTLNLGTGGTAGTLSAATVTSSSSTARVNFNHTGNLALATNFTGSLAVTKLGTGTTTLSGTNSYTGATTIQTGALLYNGNSSTASGAVTVHAGATVGGSGSKGGTITVLSGGTLAPGASIGTLTGGSAIFASGGLFALEGGGAFFDRLTLSGTATITPGALISFTISSLLTETSYTLISAASGLNGSTTFTLSGGLPAGYGLEYTGTALKLNLLSPDTAFWNGDVATTWSSFNARDTNWTTTQDGSSDTGAVPGSNSDVTFTATGAGNLNTLLDVDFTIQSLTVNNIVAIGGAKTLTVTGDTRINSGALTLHSGLTLAGAESFIGTGVSDSSSVTVTGSGSLWTNTGTFYLGSFGTGNTLTISAAGKVTVNGVNQDAHIGFNDGSSGNKLTVTGAGSEFSNDSTFYIGNKGDNNALEILDGGLATSKDVRIGGDALSSGNTATVDGAGSVWNIVGTQLRVGDAGGSNTLTLQNGGVVNVTTGLTMLGSQSTADGNAVLVTGADSKLSTVNLTIGGNGTHSTVTVAAGGNVTATGNVVIAESAGSSGKLQIGNGTTAGTVTAASISGGAGTAVVAFDHTDDISFDPQLTGSVSVTKDGAGITELTAASTYTGTTTVNMGALAISGSLIGAGNITVASNAILTGDGSVTTAVDQSVFLNGILNVQSVGSNAAATFAVTTSGTGAMVLGAGSVIAVDLLTGAGLGDNTATVGASDRLSLTGTLDATAGGTLLLGNPNHMNSFGNGDKWQVVDLNEGDGAITGKLAVNDAALGLSSTQTGSFDQDTGVYSVIETATGLQTAAAQDQSVMGTIQNALGDLNGRLFNLRSGGGEEGSRGGIASAIDDGVVMGQGDGPEDGPVAKKVLRSRLWEVYATVNYANVNLSSIGTQAGVKSQTWSPGVGIERHFTQHLAIGFVASLLETHQTYANSLGSLDIQGLALSTYASYVRDAFWVDGLYSFGMLELESERNAGVGFPTALGDTNAYTHSVQFNGGCNFRFQDNTLVTGPFAGLDYMRAMVDGYSESGGGLAALSFGSRSFDSLVSRVGWSVSKRYDTGIGAVTPQLRLSYERQNISNNNATSASLVNLPFTATTQSQSPGQDYLVVGTGVNYVINEEFSLLLSYQTQLFRQNMQAHFASLRFNYKF